MEERYIPKVDQAHIPEDGGWTEHDGVPVLLLSVPAFEDLVHEKNNGFSYAWLYDKRISGYIFCFKLNDGEEHAILFQENHARALLTVEEISVPFQIALVSTELDKVDDATPVFWFPSIEFKQRP